MMSFGERVMMRSGLRRAAAIALAGGLLGGCGSMGSFSLGPSTASAPAEPPPAAELPSSIRADEIVGRWGLAAFHKPDDRVRTETAARGQCRQPYVIGAGREGGVVMHLADEAQPQELRLKGGPGGKNYIGPPGPGGGEKDREILSFDGRVMLTKFIDPDANSRYGTMVYVRCAPRA
jgi:hypothetical protein